MAVSEMIFHVATAVGMDDRRIFRFAKNLAWRLAEDVGQHIETTAMCHSEHNLLNILPRRYFDRHVQ
ncbi:MAG TPA: hypothetical protein VMT22_06230 [Terriglobales bacterium]|nr:hypothetical protein [Terriglobales bacterium]